MKPLTLEALQELVATETVTIDFSARNQSVTIRQVTAAEASRIQTYSVGLSEDDPEANLKADIMLASVCITDHDYDTNEGREALAKLPRPMLRKIADAAVGLSGADGTVAKN